MNETVKGIVDRCTRGCLKTHFLRVTEVEFRTLLENGGEIIFKNHEETDRTFHALLALKMENNDELYFDTMTSILLP